MYAQDANFLRRLLEAGVLSPEEAQSITPDTGNALAQLLQPEQMPQPRYDVAPMQQNTLRVENGPDAGKVVPLQFASAAPVSAGMSQEKLGDRVEYMGKIGRYSQDGRMIVFPDGSRVPTNEDAWFERAKRDFALKQSDQNLRKGEAEIAAQNERTAALSAQRNIREDTTTQAYLQKQFGKPPKDMMWDASGKAIPIPGSSAELQANSAVAAGEDTLRKIDEMIGKRDAQGNLVAGAKPHAGFESAVGMPTLSSGLGLAGLFPGTDTTDFKRRLDEVKGGAFLEAFNTLKGGGQITEVEGKKATDAITRMSTSQSEAEFVKAAQEFQDVVRRGIERAKAMGGRSQQQSAPLNIPQGAIDKLRANPELRTAFDMKYGRGAAAQVLGQ